MLYFPSIMHELPTHFLEPERLKTEPVCLSSIIPCNYPSERAKSK